MLGQADAPQPLINSMSKQGSQWEATYPYARDRLLDAHSKVLALQNATEEQERQSLANDANACIFQAMGVLPE
jgi:hypothetical protein